MKAPPLVPALAIVLVGGCADAPPPPVTSDAPPKATEKPTVTPPLAERELERRAMVERQIAARGIEDERVLAAMREVLRHRFVPEERAELAYADHPLPIGYEQTISQPYVFAFMSAALELQGDEKVLEIGTGSGYQAAVLAKLAKEVYSIEIVEELADRARETLRGEGFDEIHLRTGDGYRGWPEAAPFDAIMLTAAPDHVPQPLLDQLAVGGRMILPVGRGFQDLVILEKTESGVERRRLVPVRFVPMTGEAQQDPEKPE
jgi:protein-L-isoaspartate(D-aspartate) O-methyltransferase